jgi:hypothetical protein
VSDEKQQHTAKGEAEIRRAHEEAYRLSNSAEACIELFERVGLPLIAPARHAEARAWFRASAADPQFRTQFALFAYEGALRLYEEGAFD